MFLGWNWITEDLEQAWKLPVGLERDDKDTDCRFLTHEIHSEFCVAGEMQNSDWSIFDVICLPTNWESRFNMNINNLCIIQMNGKSPLSNWTWVWWLFFDKAEINTSLTLSSVRKTYFFSQWHRHTPVIRVLPTGVQSIAFLLPVVLPVWMLYHWATRDSWEPRH